MHPSIHSSLFSTYYIYLVAAKTTGIKDTFPALSGLLLKRDEQVHVKW